MDELSLATKKRLATAKRITEHLPTRRCAQCRYFAVCTRCSQCQQRYCQGCRAQHRDCAPAPSG